MSGGYPVSTPTEFPQGWDTPTVAEMRRCQIVSPASFGRREFRIPRLNTSNNGWILCLASG